MCRVARLYVVATGQGSPCLDLRRVSAAVADATVGTGMGRSSGVGLDTQGDTCVMCICNHNLLEVSAARLP